MAYEDWTETVTCTGCLTSIKVSEIYIASGESLRTRNFCPYCNLVLSDSVESEYETAVHSHIG